MIYWLRSGAWLNAERLIKYPRLFLALYVLIGAAWVFNSNGYLDPTGKPLGTDFLNQYAASKLILAGEPEQAYDYVRHGRVENEVVGAGGFGYYGWHYPPVALLLVAPFALVSYGIALVLWMALTLTLNLLVIRRILDAPGALAASLAYPAVLINIGHGHNGFLSGALLGGALYLMSVSRHIAAGVLFGLLIYKPQFGMLIPVALLVGGYWRTFAAAALTAGLFIAVSWIAYGPETWAAFQTSTEITRTYILEQGATGWQKIQSYFSLVRGLGGSVAAAYTAQGVALLVAALAIAWLWRSPASFNLKAAGLVVGSLLATPYLLDYDLIILGLAIVYLVAQGQKGNFQPYEISFLALLWVWPLIARTVAALSQVQMTPLLLSGLLVLIVVKASQSLQVSARIHGVQSAPVIS